MKNSAYPPYSNVKVLVELLKKHGINHVVISSGTRHTPLVNILETDSFFQCYSIVDERSASFFALGLIQSLQKPVAIACTSGTAVCNYLSGLTEASFQHLPLLALTADNNSRLLYQAEQMIPQSALTNVICKKVEIPPLYTRDDFYYCQRLINEALLELNHHDPSPVNINYTIEFDSISSVTDVKNEFLKKYVINSSLPEVTKVTLTSGNSTDSEWASKANELKKAGKIMVLYGQHLPHNNEDVAVLEEFAEKYNVVYITDNLSNLHCVGSVLTYLQTPISGTKLEELAPDILITVNGNMLSDIKKRVGTFGKRFKHWMITGDGHFNDPWHCITDVFECRSLEFFKNILKHTNSGNCNNTYCKTWEASVSTPEYDSLPWSDVYVTLHLLNNLPKNSLLHLANSTTVRLGNALAIDSSIDVYCNRGTNGIDGSLSTFIGQSFLTDKLSFLIIGDLSFFYDMNGLWNRYIGNNVRIVLNNNGCGEIFYYADAVKWLGMTENLPKHIGAAHTTEAKAWVESRGFRYMSAKTKDEFDACLKDFVSDASSSPIFLEVFTDVNNNYDIVNDTCMPSQSIKSRMITSFGLRYYD
ncbi:MAG: 2-succinyl-5-enolpyruvyl-6-hydroxy-3-cyclohexene-1-carboxylic-acid synthase [Methanocorpusculum sp.]|nr:2-succinyl-5-enolpyruvyl-6-hydroxy-3-cyclohexene-1-carboxylic-acid synthase [Oscillospiraceae bacterium]MBQ3570053.1 2-succinyl-5-enolpyruvyl-6-hydroxy-3-cyclohexene-1-carboxylic-acid synthase [Methanocorpusculum sp.]